MAYGMQIVSVNELNPA